MTQAKSHDRQLDGVAQTFWERHSDRILGAAALSVLLFGTVTYHILEEWSWVDSFYFSSVAVSTVGFGDLTPSTDASKLFTILYIFSGITIITVWLNMRLKRHANRIQKNRSLTPASGTAMLPPNEAPSGPDAGGFVNPKD